MKQTIKKLYWLRIILIIISIIGAAFTLVPSFFDWLGIISSGQSKALMLTGTILWFFSATYLFNWESNKDNI
jgi:hypothetical protein